MSIEHDVDHPDQLGDAFTTFRNQVFSEISPPGTDAVRHTVQRRRTRATVTVAGVTVAALAVPVAVLATLGGDSDGRKPEDQANPVSPAPSVSATPSPTPSIVDTPITREQLLATAVDLSDWPQDAPEMCGTKNVRLQPEPVDASVPVLLDVRQGDVDGDAVPETVARLQCWAGEATAKQVVAFDRDATGRIIPLGQVVRTSEGIGDLTAIRIGQDGSVRVQVADRPTFLDTASDKAQRQWRTYAWRGDQFRQTGGPTGFPVASTTVSPSPAAASRLTISATDMVYGPADTGGYRWGTTTVTIVNTGDATVEYPAVTFPRNGRDDAVHAEWSGCPSGAGWPDRVVCVAEPLGPGERRSIPFPFYTQASGSPGPATVRVDAGSDRQGTTLPGTGQETTFQVSFS